MTIKNNRHIRKIVFMVIDIIIVLFSTIATTWLINGTTNLEANKFALLLKRSMFRQDCRNGLCVTSGNDGKEREHSVCYQFFKQIPAKRVSLPQNLY